MALEVDLFKTGNFFFFFFLTEKLPANFSQTLQTEEEKKRPKFDVELQMEPPQAPAVAAVAAVKTKDASAVKVTVM